jgi:phosphoribosylanthranilate isomerase
VNAVLRPRIKFCGITREEDAQLAADLGAWAVGFIFWPGSARCVEPERARAIVRSLPPFVIPIGVFVDQDAEGIERVASRARLGAVQLHGSERPELARSLSHRVIKAVPLTEAGEAVGLEEWSDTLILLDAHDPVRRGGTGRPIDWSAASAIARRRPIVLAGGLAPENVRRAIDQVRPAAVDVSSGVEAAPGIKDHARMRAFAAAVAEAAGGVP